MAMPETGDQALMRAFNDANESLNVHLDTVVDLDAGDIELGAVELKNGTDDTRAKVGAGTAIAEGDNALAVHDGALGHSTDASVDGDVNGSIGGRLRGLGKIFTDIWDSAVHAFRVTPARGTLTDRSGTIAAGGARQQVMAANATRRYLLFQNTDTVNRADLWIRFGANAAGSQPSILIPYGASLVMEAGFVDTDALDVFGATTGQAFTAKEA